MINTKNLKIKSNQAFTLVEFLIVIVIISLTVGIVITVTKPQSIFQKSRDAKREVNLRELERLISSMTANDPSFNELSYVSTNTLYLSLKDSSSTCGTYLSQLPSLPSGWSYRCSATPTDITGQGWLPFPFSSNPLINLSQLPIDPINKPPYYYTFTANQQGYELTAKRENKDEEIIISNSTIRLTPISRGGTWLKTYGGTNEDFAYSISQTSDGGYIVAGYTYSYGSGYSDFLILKLDSSGNVVWSKTYGGTNYDGAFSISQTSDGGYIVAGETWSYGSGGSDFLILKLDSSGNRQWSRTYGGSNSDIAQSISQTSDGGYIVAGSTWSYGSGYYDFLILKLDSLGNRQWSRTYGGSNHDIAQSISQTSDGGYIVTGYTSSYGSGYSDFLILKLDSSGNHQWSRTYGGSNSDFARSISQTSDGGYIVAGDTRSYGSGGFDFLILKLDSSGNRQWSRTYGGSNDDVPYSISQTSDGGYIVAGDTRSYGSGGSDFLILKLDSSGNVVWSKTYGETNYDGAYSISQTSDGGYIVAGQTSGYVGYKGFLILKLDSSGSINNCSLTQNINISSSSPSVSFSSPSVSFSSPSVSSSSPSVSSSSPSVSSQKICPGQ